MRTPFALPSPATTIATVALVAALGGVGYAAVNGGLSDSSGAFHGCVNNRTGVLRVVAKGTQCRSAGRGAETAISWAQQGRRGAAGAAGAAGPAGAAGAPG